MSSSLAQVDTIYKRFLVMPNIMPDPVTTVEKVGYLQLGDCSNDVGDCLQEENPRFAP